MIEAVNSVLANAPYTKAAVEQQSVAASFAANPEKVQQAAQAPFISPYVHVDVNYDKAVLLLRDSATGDVVRQIPTESQLEAYKRAQTAALKPKVEAKHTAPVESSAPQVQTSSVDVQLTQQAPAPQVEGPIVPLPQATSSDTSFAPKAGTIVSVDTSA